MGGPSAIFLEANFRAEGLEDQGLFGADVLLRGRGLRLRAGIGEHGGDEQDETG